MLNNSYYFIVLVENHKTSKRGNYIIVFLSGFEMYETCKHIVFSLL